MSLFSRSERDLKGEENPFKSTLSVMSLIFCVDGLSSSSKIDAVKSYLESNQICELVD